MDREKLKKHLPTVITYVEKRRKARLNQLPKHLRPPEVWPLWIQAMANVALIITLSKLMINRYDFLSEATPAMILVVCLLLLIYTLISAFRMRRRYQTGRGRRLAKINFACMVLAFLFWVGAIVVFLP